MGAATRHAHFTHTLLLSTAWPPSEATDTVITDTLLSVDAVLGLKQCLLTVHVKVTFSYSNVQDKVNCFTKTLQVRVQLLEWQAAVHLYILQYTGSGTGVGKQLHTLPPHPTLGKPQVFAEEGINSPL